MDADVYRELLAAARRLAPREADAQDLVQETLLAAWRAGRVDMPWMIGTLRHQAVMAARAGARRAAREAALEPPSPDSPPAEALPALPPMPRASRRVAVLALHGLGADEIRALVGLSPEAFRQRVAGIRRALAPLPAAQRAEALALAYVRDLARSVELRFGLVRRALLSAMGGGPGLGTHDADGHLLVLRRGAHVFALRGNG